LQALAPMAPPCRISQRPERFPSAARRPPPMGPDEEESTAGGHQGLRGNRWTGPPEAGPSCSVKRTERHTAAHLALEVHADGRHLHIGNSCLCEHCRFCNLTRRIARKHLRRPHIELSDTHIRTGYTIREMYDDMQGGSHCCFSRCGLIYTGKIGLAHLCFDILVNKQVRRPAGARWAGLVTMSSHGPVTMLAP